MGFSNVIVYGANWCPDCTRAKKFLGEQLIRFRWVDIEQDKQARAYVEKINNGKRIIPTIVFDDGSILVEPSNAELAAKLGIHPRAKMDYYSLIIIGGGPAGLTASMYTAREGFDTLVIERGALGGQAGITSRIENFPGFPEGLSGTEFAERIVTQARRFGVEILSAQDVARLEFADDFRIVHLSDGSAYNASAVLIATGATYRKLDVPGEDEYIGAGIHFCATCDAPFYRGADHLIVIGGGNSAVEEGMWLTQFAKRVTLLVRGDALAATRTAQERLAATPGIDVRYHTAVTEFRGNGKMNTVVARDMRTGTREEFHPAGVFVLIGSQPNNRLVQDLVALDEYGYILTGHDLVHNVQQQIHSGAPIEHLRMPHAMETSVRGVFAAGDVRSGSTKQVASAVGEGASAAIAIREYLRNQ